MINYNEIKANIYPHAKMPDRGLIERILNLSTPNIVDVTNRFGTLDYRIKPIVEGIKAAGPALTVKLLAGDNYMAHEALLMAKSGDMIIISCDGNMRNSPWGEIMCTVAQKKGAVGVVIDGTIRDVQSIRKMRYPLFARGASSSGCNKNGQGMVNVPISCGGVVVNPGDVVFGDDTGVVVVPQSRLEEVVKKAEDKVENEKIRLEEIRKGNLMPSFLKKRHGGN